MTERPDQQSASLPGDHLCVDFGVYRHHGIDMGDGLVIHFGRGLTDLPNAKVEQVTRREFARGREIMVINSPAEFEAEEILRRANSRLGETGYNLFENNCEHFVNWCRSDRSASSQIDHMETIARQATAAATRPLVKRLLSRRLAGSVAAKIAARGGGAALVADAAQTVVEIVATSRGADKDHAEKLGKRTGAATAMATGFVGGGPVGGAAGFTLWAIGQYVAGRITTQTRDAVDSTLHGDTGS